MDNSQLFITLGVGVFFGIMGIYGLINLINPKFFSKMKVTGSKLNAEITPNENAVRFSGLMAAIIGFGAAIFFIFFSR